MNNNTEQSTLTQKPETRSLPVKWMVHLFNEMDVAFGSKFAQAYGHVDRQAMAEIWSRELAGYTPAELKAGHRALMSACDWPPTLPEFKRMCRPPIDPEQAWHAATRAGHQRANGEFGDWPSSIVYWAYVNFGHYDLMHMAYVQGKARWQNCLNKAQSDFEDGKLPNIPQPHLALPAARSEGLSNTGAVEVIQKATQSMKKGPEIKQNPKEWAQRILDHPEGKTQTVIEIAKRALNNTL